MAKSSVGETGNGDSLDEHTKRILAYTASYARTHATAYTTATRSGYFYLRRYELVDEALSRLPHGGGHLVDVGCGVGHAGPLAARYGYLYAGIDLSSEMIAEARAAAFNPAATFTVASVEDLPLDANSADVVLALGILEYVRVDRQAAAIAEIARVLKPGGTLIASVLNRISPVWIVRDLRGQASRARARLLRRTRPAGFPEHLFTRGEVRDLLSAGGLLHTRTVGYAMTMQSEEAYKAHPDRSARVAAARERYGVGTMGNFAMAHFVVATAPADSVGHVSQPTGSRRNAGVGQSNCAWRRSR